MRRLLILALTATCFAQTPTLVQWTSSTSPYTNLGQDGSSGATSFTVNLPNPAISGNCGIFAFRGTDNSGTVSVADDKGDNFTQQATVDDTTNSMLGQIWTSALTAGARSVTVTFGSGKTYVSAVAGEFYNSSCVADGHNGNHGTSTTMQAGSFTPSQSGDLVVQYALNDTDYNVTSFTAGSQTNITWNLLSADVAIGNSTSESGYSDEHENAVAAQYGIYNSTSAFNPQMSQSGGTTGGYLSVAVALKAASAGGPDTSHSMRVTSVEHILLLQNSTGTMTLQFPCHGNLVLGLWIGGSSDDLSGITTGGTAWSNTGPLFGTSDRTWYLPSPTACSSTFSPAITFASTLADPDNIFFYDVVGAATSPYDTSATNSGSQEGGGNLTTISITPTTSNGLVIAELGVVSNGPAGLTGSNQYFDSEVWGNEAYSLGSTPNDFADELGGWAHYYNPNTSSVSFNWTQVGNYPYNGWVSRADSFKAGPVGVNDTISGVQVRGGSVN